MLPATSLPPSSSPDFRSVDCLDDLQPGAFVDNLQVERLIGEGAMANLYLVRDKTGQQRVIKVPRQSLTVDPVSTVAFENELRLAPYLADFRYAYMPRIEGLQRRPYLSMHYIQGQDLWSYLKQHGPLSEAETLDLGIKIAHAVGELHRRRIVHLDLKLSNVMLTHDGEIRLIDFGLANHLDLPDLIFESFREPKGTPAYIAPEQFIGVRDEPRSDLFSVGVMLFELATGKLPYREQSTVLDVISRIKTRPLAPRYYRPDLSASFESIVTRCLIANPDNRYCNMQALGDALKASRDNSTTASAAAAADPAPVRRTGLAGAVRGMGNYFHSRWKQRGDRFYDDVTRWAERHRQQQGPQPYRILIPLNLDASLDTLNLAVLRQAALHARGQENAYLTVMSAVFVDIGMAGGDREASLVNTATATARRRIRRLLDLLDCSGLTVNIHVVASNHPVDAIQQYASDYAVDLVVIGCRPKNPLAAFVHGRTGYNILTRVQCNVFVVHAPLAAAARAPMVVAAVNA